MSKKGNNTTSTVKTYCATGKKLLDEGKYLLALEYFQAASDLDADAMDALYGLVCTYKALGKFDRAEQVQVRIDALVQNNPSAGSYDMTTQGQLEEVKKRYANLLKTLVSVEKDKYGLKHAFYSPDAIKELTACEGLIEYLEQQLKLKPTNFPSVRNAALAKRSSGFRRVKWAILWRLFQYRVMALFRLRKMGWNSIGVKLFGYSAASMDKLKRKEVEIRSIDACLPNNYLGTNTFSDIRNRYSQWRSNISKQWVAWKLKRKYAFFVFRKLVKTKYQSVAYELNYAAREKERLMHSQIAALDVRGNEWCRKTTEKMVKLRKKLPSRIGCGLAVIAGLVLLYYYWKYMLVIAVLAGIVAYFRGDI